MSCKDSYRNKEDEEGSSIEKVGRVQQEILADDEDEDTKGDADENAGDCACY